MTGMRVLVIAGEDPWRPTGSPQRVGATVASLEALDRVDRIDLFLALTPQLTISVPAPFHLAGRADLPTGGSGLGLALAAWAARRPRAPFAGNRGDLGERVAAVLADMPDLDLVWVVREWLLDAVAPALQAHAPHVPVICDVDDLDEAAHRTRRQEDDLSAPARLAARIDEAMVPALRAASQGHADLLLAASPADIGALGAEGRLLPNTYPTWAEDLPAPPTDAPPTVLFAGSMGYWPNRLGRAFLLDEVWPHVRAALPTAQLHLVGPTLRDDPVGELPGGVTIAGRVPEMTPWLTQAHVIATPVFGGAGTAIKVLEGFAARRPVVGTPYAFRGLPEPATLGHVSEDAADFAALLVDQLRTPDVERVARARQFVEEHHSPAAFRRTVDALVAEVAPA